MSSPEEDRESVAGPSFHAKKRRVQRARACDGCRRKKVRCDAGQKPDHRCSNCITNKLECAYIEAAPKKPIPKSYVRSLEDRLQKMEALIDQLRPDTDLSESGEAKLDPPSPESDQSNRVSANVLLTSGVSPAVSSPDTEAVESSGDEAIDQETLTSRLRKMQINPAHKPFFGKASSIKFLQNAVEAKLVYAGGEIPSSSERIRPGKLRFDHPQFWEPHPWILPMMRTETPHRDFPDKELMCSLIGLYFDHVNDYAPVLHRPTFERNIHDGLHLHDEGFGSTVLLVCALGSRFSDDPRVFLEGADSTHSCGWPWFSQVQYMHRSILSPPRLSDIQFCCLSVMFLMGTSTPQTSWHLIGVGIRLAQDVGAHRQKVYNAVRTVEEELWKRAFWVLIYLDRILASGLGRECTIQDEDFDLDPPAECDDEYWVVSNNRCEFRHPANKPSKITFFNCLLRLNQILAYALRTIYSLKKSKILLGFVGPEWEQRIVAELDSALNKWIDSIPEHLQWDPHRENILFLSQSAYLYAHYYQVQIAVHRPFIPSPRDPSPLSFPSLAICTNAARSCVHVLDVPFRRRSTTLFLYSNLSAMFMSAIVLLLNIWGGKRSGLSIDTAKDMADVHKCMSMLKSVAPRWYCPGRLWDILHDLATVGNLPLPQSTPTLSKKRGRDSDNPYTHKSSQSSSLPSSSTVESPYVNGVHHVAGSRQVPTEAVSYQQPQQVPIRNYPNIPTPASRLDVALPIHTEDLGRLPLHPGYNVVSSMEEWSTSQPSPYSGHSSIPTTFAPIPIAATTGHNFEPSMFAPQPSMPSQSAFSNSGPQSSSSASQILDMGTTFTHDGAATSMIENSVDHALPVFPEHDTLAMWSNAPEGFEWDNWESFINSVSGINNPPNLDFSS